MPSKQEHKAKNKQLSDCSVHKHSLDTSGTGHFTGGQGFLNSAPLALWVRRVMAVSSCLTYCGILAASLAFIHQMPAVATKNVSTHFQMSLVGEQSCPRLKTTEVDRPKSFISSSCDYFISINFMLHPHMYTHICESHHLCYALSQWDSVLLL